MNGLFGSWSNPSVYQIQSWGKQYIIRSAAPWPKGMNRSNNGSISLNENSMW